MDIPRIARVAYDARRSFALTQGEGNHPEWFKLDSWQRHGMVEMTKTIILNRGVTPWDLHALFLRMRRDDGWSHGPRFDLQAKRDPLMVVWDKLPATVRAGDELVIAVVRHFSSQAVVA